MQLAVVALEAESVGPDDPVDSLIARLLDRPWHAVHAPTVFNGSLHLVFGRDEQERGDS